MTQQGPDAPRAFIERLARAMTTTAIVGFAATVTLVTAAFVATLAIDDTTAAVTSTDAPMLEVAPGGVIDPADVPEAMAVLYRAAEDHSDVYAEVPCFCGCQDMLGHRHLLDCFVRADGAGWEAHASGCGVCLGEAQQVEDLLAAGTIDPDEIKDAVVATWGDPYTTN